MLRFGDFIYYILLALILGFGLWLGRGNRRDFKSALYAGGVSLLLALTAGLRYGIGFDYNNYRRLFEELAQQPWDKVFSGPYEPGFVLFTKLLQMVSTDLTFLYMCYALVMMAMIGAVVWRRSERPWLSFFIFVTLQYFGSAMNLLRQTFAAYIFLLAIPFLHKKKPLPYMLIVLLAASFHKSALILIPVYFIARLPLNKWAGIVYGGGGLLAFLFSDVLLRFVTSRFYSAYSQDMDFYAGSKIDYVMVPVLLAALVIVFKNKVCRQDGDNLVYVNLMVYGAFFELMMVRHFIVQRFAIYFMLPQILALPLLVKSFEPQLQEPAPDDGKFRSKRAQAAHVKKELKERRQIYLSVVTAICLACFVHFLIAFNFNFHKIYPYYSIFSEEAKREEFIPNVTYSERVERQRQLEEEGMLDPLPVNR